MSHTHAPRCMTVEACRLQIVVRVIAENAGLNATEVIGQLSAAHASGHDQAGLDIETGQPKDLATIGLVDLFSTKVPSSPHAEKGALIMWYTHLS